MGACKAESGGEGHPRRRDYGYVFLADFLVILSTILIYRLADRFLGQSGFSEYVLVRRTLSLAMPVLFLGVGVALPRQVALVESRPGESPLPSFLAALLIVGVPTAACVLAANIFPGALSHLIFGDAGHASIVASMSFVLVGLSLNGLCYAYFRGRMLFGRGSLLCAVSVGLIPVGAFWLAEGSVASVLRITGLSVTAVSLVGLVSIFASARIDFSRVVERGKALLSYGVRRVPGNFALSALLSTPAILAAHFVGLREAGMVGFGCALVGLGGSAVAPIGKILLPEASRMLATGRRAELRRHVHKLLWFGLGLAIPGTALALLLMNVGVKLYLGPEYVAMAGTVRVVIVAAPAYVVYVCLRSVIDAAHRRAINAHNCYIALLLYAAIACGGRLIWGGLTPVLVGFVSGICALGALTWVRAERTLARAGADPTEES